MRTHAQPDHDLADVVEILAGDYERKGRLDQSDVARIAAKRRLAPEQLEAALTELGRLGIVAIEADDFSDYETAPSGEASGKRHPTALLTRERERELANVMRLGIRLASSPCSTERDRRFIEDGRRAREALILHNLRLVHWVANRWRGRHDHEDLFQEGIKGLIRAVEMFDPDLNVRFASYARWWIEQSIRRGVDDTTSTIRIPVYRLQQIRQFRRMFRRLRFELGCDPTVMRVAAALDWSVEETAFIADLARYRTVELDAPLKPGSDTAIKDVLQDSHETSPEQQVIDRSLQEHLQALISELPARSQDVLRKRFGLDTGRERTLEEPPSRGA